MSDVVAAVRQEIDADLRSTEMLLVAARVKSVAESVRFLCGVLDELQGKVSALDREMETLDEWVQETDLRLGKLEGRS